MNIQDKISIFVGIGLNVMVAGIVVFAAMNFHA